MPRPPRPSGTLWTVALTPAGPPEPISKFLGAFFDFEFILQQFFSGPGATPTFPTTPLPRMAVWTLSEETLDLAVPKLEVDALTLAVTGHPLRAPRLWCVGAPRGQSAAGTAAHSCVSPTTTIRSSG